MVSSMNTRFTAPEDAIKEALERYETPFYLYDEHAMRQKTDLLYGEMRNKGFDSFMNFYAVKALPNPHVLRALVAMGHGLDCSSLAELLLAEQIGATGELIMFTSSNTRVGDFVKAHELGAIINFDDPIYVDSYLKEVGVPRIACCRFNPGNAFSNSEESSNMLRGNPSEQKYGMDRAALLECYKDLRDAGVQRFGLHTMLLSNNLSWQNHAEVARIMFELAVYISKELSISFEFINLGGGIGVAYRPNDSEFDLAAFSDDINESYTNAGLSEYGSPRIVMENGRFITASAGWLVTSVRNIKRSHKTYVGVDASMADLMRPGMYGAYHHISLVGAEEDRGEETVDIVGSLCENNDKFAVDRTLPALRSGDVLIIHTAGAHGHAMGFNYNGILRSAEYLHHEDDSLTCIRRAETYEDLFATIAPLERVL